MDSSLGIGIIGTGRHGSRYARHIREDVGGLHLAAISRRSAEGASQAESWNCRFHADFTALVDDPAVDAVLAVVTPDLNPSIAQACGAARKPLLLEKPLAIDTASAERALQAMGDTPFTIAQTLRFNSVIRSLRDELPRAGRLFSFYANQRLEPSTLPWLADPRVAGGGVILHTAVHMFDALRFITGREVLRVRASSFQRHNPALEDLFTAQLEMSDDLVGTVDASKVGPARAGCYEFVGSEGQLQGDQIHDSLSFVSGTEIQPLPLPEAVPTLRPLLELWRGFLLGEGENPVPATEGLAAIRVCEACRLSAAGDKWIEV